jgi:hypothetical protein
MYNGFWMRKSIYYYVDLEQEDGYESIFFTHDGAKATKRHCIVHTPAGIIDQTDSLIGLIYLIQDPCGLLLLLPRLFRAQFYV